MACLLRDIVDGPNIVIPAMNGWADPEPSWWLNLQADPNASIELPDGPRDVKARAALGEERDRLWARFLALESSAYTDASAALRSRETALVVLEPRAGGEPEGQGEADGRVSTASSGWSRSVARISSKYASSYFATAAGSSPEVYSEIA